MSVIYINSYQFAVAAPPGAIVTNGLVLNLDAGDPSSYPGTGTIWTDISGNGNTGTLINGPTFNNANGGSIVCDGIDDYILANTTSLNSQFPSTSVSLFTWVYPTSAGQIVAELGQTTINSSWHDSSIEISTAGAFSFSTWHNSLTNRVVSSNQPFNQWYYIGYTYAVNGNTLTAYINDLSVGTAVLARVAPYDYGAEMHYALCAVSNQNMGTIGYAGARIGNFAVYNRALTAAEVTHNFNALKGRYGL